MIGLTVASLLGLCSNLYAAGDTSFLVNAQTQFQEDHYEQALKLYKQAQDKAGTDSSIEYNIGLCHLRLGDGDKAIQHFEGVTSGSEANPSVSRDAFFNVGLIRAEAARQQLEELSNPKVEEEAETPPPSVDAPENIEELKSIAGELLRAITLFRECQRIEPREDAEHNVRAIRITRRNVLGLLKSAVEAKEREDMLDDPPAFLELLIAQQRTSSGLTRLTFLRDSMLVRESLLAPTLTGALTDDPPETDASRRQARRGILRLQRQIMERTGMFADHLAQFVESVEEEQASPADQPEKTPREQVYHAVAKKLESAIGAQRDAAAFLMDAEIAPSFDQQVVALDEMYVALRLFPQEPQKALVKARTEQIRLKEAASDIESDSDWLRDPILGNVPIPDGAELKPDQTALHYDQSKVLEALAVLRMQCEQIAASQSEEETPQSGQERPPQMDPELNRQLASVLAGVDAWKFQCLDAVAAREKETVLAKQQEILDMIDAALDLLPKTIEQRIAELVVRQTGLNEEVKAEVSRGSPAAGQETGTALEALHQLAAAARSDVVGADPSQVAQRIRYGQNDVYLDTESVQEELRGQIPTGSSDPTGASVASPDGQSPEVQAYIEASKHVEQAGFEMLVALESLDKAIVQNSLGPMESEGPVQAAQAKAREELVKALSALRPPEDQPECDKQQQQDQQQQQEPQDQSGDNARRAVERADQEREKAEQKLYQRRPRTVIKDW